MNSTNESGPRALYHGLLEAWNARNAAAMAHHFADDGSMVGFDGSQVNGCAGIEAHLGPVFGDHPTAKYTGIVEEVRQIAPGIMLLRAVAGMVQPGKDDFKPELNTVHSLVALATGSGWRATLFQSTPAAWHGRGKDVESLLDRLRDIRSRGMTVAA